MSAIDIKTIFCDIDGCIFRHSGPNFIKVHPAIDLLPGVLEKFRDWMDEGYTVVLTTGRPSSLRQETIRQLKEAGLWFDHIIMGLPRGQRIVINDMKINSAEPNAVAINLIRNKGLIDAKC